MRMAFSDLKTKHLLVFTFLLLSGCCFAQTPPATFTAAIGTPANGAAHYINLNWSTVAGATGYELQYSTDGTNWNALYNGTALTYSHNTGALGNKPFYYQVRTLVNSTQSAWLQATQYPIYTACDVAALPLLSNAQPFSMTLALQPEAPDTNPAYTTYAIYCPTTSQYVQANGTLGATEVYQTRTAWGNVNVNGLNASTSYCFYAKAKNMDGDVRVGSGAAIGSVETFTTNSNFATGTSTTTKFYSPSTCNSNSGLGGLVYNASGGCTDGYIGYSKAWNDYWGCYLRTPATNCTGNSSVVLNFDLSNSYIASHVQTSPSNSDAIRFYMWIDNGYKQASSIKINGVEVSSVDGNGYWLKYDVLRNCVNVSVTFDLSTSTNLSNVLFYLEPKCSYNDSQVWSTKIDNVSIQSSATPTACLSTTACTAAGIQTQPTNRTICEGSNTTFGITATGGVAAYQWQVNNGGGWANATGGVYSNGNTATLSISGATAAMSSYQYRCQVTGSCSGNPLSNTVTLTVNALPGAAGTIQSATGYEVCQSQTGVTYSVNSVSGATGYNWTLPQGATISSGNNTATITVNYSANALSGNIVVTPTNTCGNGTASPLYGVAVNSVPELTAGIAGSTAVCEFFDETYSITPAAGATGYTWTLPAGWMGIQNGTSITATAMGAGGDVMVTADNACGSSAPVTLAVTITPVPDMPGTITGNDQVCKSSTGNNYSVAAVAGATSYTWTLPNGWNGTSTTNSIAIDVDASTGQIEVTADNACGTSLAQTKTITVLGEPDAPGAVTGPEQTCEGDTVTYTIADVAGATSYEWSGPVGEVITDDGGTTYTFIATATGSPVTVLSRGDCGASAETNKSLAVNPLPAVDFTLQQFNYCQNSSVVTLSGGTPAGGIYGGPAVSNNSFDPSLLAAPANYILQYTYTDNNGCTAHDTAALSVSICSGINDIAGSAISIYPNPFGNQLTIQLNNTTTAVATLTDITGRVVERISINNSTYHWNTANLAKGVYTLSIGTGNTTTVTKVVKSE